MFRTILIALLFVSGCENNVTYTGSSHGGFESFPEMEINVEKALSLAEPYIDKTFYLRLKNRTRRSNKEAAVWVTWKENWYYIVKDNYPSYTPGFYLKHAVKVNSQTGEVVEPN